MRKLTLILVVLILSSTFIFAQKSDFNLEKSSIEWKGKKIGGQHIGNIQLKSGNIETKGNKIISGTIIIDMSTIINTDISDQEYNKKLVGHLKSPDFFSVEKYPTAILVITKSSKFKNNKAIVSADLTIKGKTEAISFELRRGTNKYTTNIDIDRSKFDVRYGSTSFFDKLGDKAIADIFTLSISLIVKQKINKYQNGNN